MRVPEKMGHISFRKTNVLHKRALLYYPQLQKEQSQYYLQYQDILAILLLWIILSSPFFVSTSCLCGFLNLSLRNSQIFFVYFPNCICGFLGLYCQGRHAWPCGPSVLHTFFGFLSRSLKENIFEHKFVCKLCFSSILNQKHCSDWTHAMFGDCRMCKMAHAE